ncbi:MAG: tetratricopeptide repeat protein [Anaerolineales bacterium]
MSEETQTMLQDAVEALRQGERQRARDLLTRLLKEDQNNPDVWVWLSTAVETPKERLYCLQTAIKLDPQNAAARRGLVMLGAMPPDPEVKPFPLNHPRPWEEKVTLTEEQDKPRGIRGLVASPMGRLAGIVALGVLMIGAIILFTTQNASGIRPFNPVTVSTRTPGPSPTFSPTVTSIGGTPRATPTFFGPTPLSAFLDATYTPTPLYVDTPHPGTEAYRAGMRFFLNGDYQNAIALFQQLLTNEPGAVDGYYYIGLSYLRLRQPRQALDAFQSGINANPDFAPNYLGRALARLALDEKANVLEDLNAAVQLDGNYLEALLRRGQFALERDDTRAALQDFEAAVRAAPGSPLAHLGLAQVHLALGNAQDAIAAARQANQLDITLLEAYLVLGKAYVANGQVADAVAALDIYTRYVTDDVEAFLTLAAGYNESGDYEKALDAANRAVRLAARNWRGYYQRAQAYLGLKDPQSAFEDFDQAFKLNNQSFEAGLGKGIARIAREDYNNAYVDIINVEKLIKTGKQRAEFLYYRALSLDGIGQRDIAYRDWMAILNLPESDTTPAMRATARERAFALRTPTPTIFASDTPAAPATSTPPTRTPTP